MFVLLHDYWDKSCQSHVSYVGIIPFLHPFRIKHHQTCDTVSIAKKAFQDPLHIRENGQKQGYAGRKVGGKD